MTEQTDLFPQMKKRKSRTMRKYIHFFTARGLIRVWAETTPLPTQSQNRQLKRNANCANKSIGQDTLRVGVYSWMVKKRKSKTTRYVPGRVTSRFREVKKQRSKTTRRYIHIVAKSSAGTNRNQLVRKKSKTAGRYIHHSQTHASSRNHAIAGRNHPFANLRNTNPEQPKT